MEMKTIAGKSLDQWQTSLPPLAPVRRWHFSIRHLIFQPSPHLFRKLPGPDHPGLITSITPAATTVTPMAP